MPNTIGIFSRMFYNISRQPGEKKLFYLLISGLTKRVYLVLFAISLSKCNVEN